MSPIRGLRSTLVLPFRGLDFGGHYTNIMDMLLPIYEPPQLDNCTEITSEIFVQMIDQSLLVYVGLLTVMIHL